MNFKLSLSPDELKQRFFALQTRQDIANLLEVKEDQLVYHLYIVPQKEKYVTFDISRKSSNKPRTISTPITGLKIIQIKLNQILQAVYEPKLAVHSFIAGKSIVSNARQHKNKLYVFNIDLENFYPSINFGRVWGMFQAYPYRLNVEVSTILAQICCFRNELPQGAPTSPIISNMICSKLDSQLLHLTNEHGCIYTRYADDITFSNSRKTKVFPRQIGYIKKFATGDNVVVGQELQQIIKDNGFRINAEKIRFQNGAYQRQVVTGLTVNDTPNVKRQYIQQIRAMLHAWGKFGLEAAEQEYWNRYAKKARSSFHKKPRPSFAKVLKGKIDFLGMVRGKNNSKYKRFLNQYFDLMYGKITDAVWQLEKIFDKDGDVIVIQGTAFFLKGVGLITCAHVLDEGIDGLIASQPNNSTSYPVELVVKDKELDIAILNITVEKKRELLARPENDELKIGDNVTLLGFPNYVPNSTITIKTCHITKFQPLFAIERAIIINEPIVYGNSGGPVLDALDRVIGIAAIGVENDSNQTTDTFGVIPISLLEQVIKSNKLK